MDETDWPGVALIDIAVEVCAQWSGLRDVEPLFSRQPYEDWCRLFRFACEEEDSLDWKGAGFVRCTPQDIVLVRDLLEAITESVNEEFRAFLARALIQQPVAAREIIAIEGSFAAGASDGGHRCGFRSDV